MYSYVHNGCNTGESERAARSYWPSKHFAMGGNSEKRCTPSVCPIWNIESATLKAVFKNAWANFACPRLL